MNKPSREALDAYYREADSWGQDREQSLRASRRIAWWVAAGAALIAILEAIALVTLMPLKTVEPYTLLVDRNTGYVQALEPLNPARIEGDTALTQSFLVQYVIAREGFDISAVQGDYRKVALWSGESARSSYLATMQSSNPESPLARYPRSTIVSVRVKSVSPMGRNLAMVRYDTQRRDINGQMQAPQPFVAMIRYRYSGEPMTLEDRFINPLGFQVLRYRRDQEALPPTESEAPAVAQPASGPAQPQRPATAPAAAGQQQRPGTQP